MKLKFTLIAVGVLTATDFHTEWEMEALKDTE